MNIIIGLAGLSFVAFAYSILGVVQSASMHEAGNLGAARSADFWKASCAAFAIVTVGFLVAAWKKRSRN